MKKIYDKYFSSLFSLVIGSSIALTSIALTSVVLISVALSGCQKPKPIDSPLSESEITGQSLPKSWVVTNNQETPVDQPLEEPSAQVSSGLDRTFATQAIALEQSTAFVQTEPPTLSQNHPKDWVPWHREYLITDLAVTVSGWIGTLVNKGTPSVSVLWRRQYETHPQKVSEASFQASHEMSPGAIFITANASPGDLKQALEPTVQAALSTKRITNEQNLRINLLQATRDFQSITQSLESSPSGAWWVSAYRVDLAIDASGKVTPLIDLAGELKVRLEWHRLMKSPPTPVTIQLPHAPSASFLPTNPLASELLRLTDAVSEEMTAATDEYSGEQPVELVDNYKAYTVRIGLGVTHSGKVGIAKLNETVTGYLYFTRNVKKPTVNPKPVHANVITSADTSENSIPLISSLSEDSIGLFKNKKPLAEVSRKKLRRGLKKALKMGAFFGRHASVTRAGHWKIFEIRTAVELSLKGTAGLATLTAFPSIEIRFYNQKF